MDRWRFLTALKVFILICCCVVAWKEARALKQGRGLLSGQDREILKIDPRRTFFDGTLAVLVFVAAMNCCYLVGDLSGFKLDIAALDFAVLFPVGYAIVARFRRRQL